MDDPAPRHAGLTSAERHEVAEKMAACPFVGPAVATGLLEVLRSASEPLASIEAVAELGDRGGGDLGRRVLKLFARGNHSRMPGGAGGALVPSGTFSLRFGGSQGAHPGHSGILLGDPDEIGHGRLDRAAFARLAGHGDRNGRLSVDAAGDFIADNLRRDPGARVLPLATIANDGFGLVREVRDVLLGGDEGEETEAFEALTKLLGDDHLMGSAGEWGLLFAFLKRSPRSRDGDIALADVELMFVEKRLPDGWETWKKTSLDWVEATLRLAKDASLAFHFGRT